MGTFSLLCEALRVSPTYLLAEVLPSMEFSDMDVLLELWQTATPKQIAMMSSMILYSDSRELPAAAVSFE